MNNPYEFRDFKQSTITKSDIVHLIDSAKKSTGRVYRFNLHEDYSDPLQEMLVCLLPDSPKNIHKHQDRDEVITIIEGCVKITFFDEEHITINEVILDRSDYSLFCRIPQNVWHQVESIKGICVIHEVSRGPYDSTQMVRKDS